MLSFKSVTSLFLILNLIMTTNSYALIKKIDQFSNGHSLLLDIWFDDHKLGSKEENLNQLKVFVEKVLATERVHLIIESSFFYQADYKTTDLHTWLEGLSQRLKSPNKWSFYNSPQHSEQNTWIAWELPLVILSIFNNQELPSFIDLTPEQKKHIIQNVSVEFFDPRLALDTILNNESIECIYQKPMQKFNEANNSSPKKLARILSDYVDSRYQNAPSSRHDHLYGAHLFDVEALSSVVGLVNENQKQKKLYILCGEWHALHLEQVLPSMGLVKLKATPPSEPKQKPPACRRLDFS